MIKHEFTDVILEVVYNGFGDLSVKIFANSYLLQYFNVKTKSATAHAPTKEGLPRNNLTLL